VDALINLWCLMNRESNRNCYVLFAATKSEGDVLSRDKRIIYKAFNEMSQVCFLFFLTTLTVV
jgi:hypothetical protein